MPSSHWDQLNEITELIVLTDPQRGLDVGVGFGKYGVLAREYLELADGREVYGDWRRTIDGIEAFPGYLTALHRFVYDHVFVGNALDVVPALDGSYDLILLVDVLEHFDRADGMAVLDACRRRGRNLLISTPRDIRRQEQAFDNVFETHRSRWRPRDLRGLGETFWVRNADSLICYAGADAARVGSAFSRSRRKQAIKRAVPFLVPALRAASRRFARGAPGRR